MFASSLGQSHELTTSFFFSNGQFHLQRLYLSHIGDLSRVLVCQPDLEALGLWFKWSYVSTLQSKQAKLKWDLTQHRLNSLATLTSSTSPRPGSPGHHEDIQARSLPIVFGIEDIGFADQHALFIFDYQRMYAEANMESDTRADNRPLDIPNRNNIMFKRITEDLGPGFSKDTNLCLVLPDMSPLHLYWAERVIVSLCRLYLHSFGGIRFVRLSVIDPPLPSLNVVRYLPSQRSRP